MSHTLTHDYRCVVKYELMLSSAPVLCKMLPGIL